ncbi:MAG: TonB family protein [Gammaproteobacteria bacterium]
MAQAMSLAGSPSWEVRQVPDYDPALGRRFRRWRDGSAGLALMVSVAAHASVAALFLTHDAVPVETGQPIVVEIVVESALPVSNAASPIETKAAVEAQTNEGMSQPPTDGVTVPETDANLLVALASQEIANMPIPDTPPVEPDAPALPTETAEPLTEPAKDMVEASPSPVSNLEPIAQRIAVTPPPPVALPSPPRRPARHAALIPDPAPPEPELTERADPAMVGPAATDKDAATAPEAPAHDPEPAITQVSRTIPSAALGGQRTEALAASGNPRPPYPAGAVRRGLEGRVILDVEVLITGRVGEIRVAESSGHGQLDRAAIKGVRKWRFKPAKLAGIDVRSRVRVPVRFELER